MALTKIITDTIDLSSDTTALKMPKGTTAQRPDGIDIDYLIVAGGGGGASTAGNGNGAGGGGAGGVLTGFTKVDGAAGTQTFDIEVGLGGAGGAATTSPADGNGNPGVNGNNSIFHSFTAIGGGGGGNRSSNGLDGGSGGGSGCYGGSPYGLPGSGTSGQGNNGGTGEAYYGPNYYGGGGGGAGNAGSASVGGDGIVSSLITTSMASTYSVGEVDSSKVYFAGGGGGGRWTGGSGTGTGGLGGGGTGGTSSDNDTAGSNGTGGGGGGASWYGSYGTGYNGSDGGNGVIILSTNEASAVVTAGVTVNGTAGAGTRSGLVNGDKYVYIITVATAGDTISFTQAPGDVPDTVPVVGTMRENTTTGKMEIYTGAKGWRALQQTAQGGNIVPSNNFNTVLYTGNASARSINVGFKPDLTWIKDRTTNYSHVLIDSVRGPDSEINSNDTTAEYIETSGLTDFTSTGFDLGTLEYSYNKTNDNYVSWNWKAGGNSNTFNIDDVGYDTAAAAGMNTGTITPTGCSVNTEAGFSIVQYTGTGNASDTVSHGLGSAPDLVMYKDITNPTNWNVYVSSAPSTYNPYGGILDLNYAFNTSGGTNGSAGTPSSTVLTFTAGSSTVNTVNALNASIITYSWRSIPGYSLIGMYTGTDDAANTPIIYTGFEPAWIMVKCVDSARAWNITDNKRNTINPRNSVLQAQSSDQEYTDVTYNINFYNDGFQIVNANTGWNITTEDYIFMCFAS